MAKEQPKEKSKEKLKAQPEQKNDPCSVYKDKITDLTSSLQRLQADTENLKKHTEKEIAASKKRAVASFVEQTLTILDSFELALKNTQDVEQFKKGVELIYSQLYDMLEQQGLKRMNTAGEMFDPYKHEVLMSEPTQEEADDNKIVEELQSGYFFADNVLRYAKVKVKKKTG